MTKINVTRIEEQTHGRLLYNVRAETSEGRVEFPIGVRDLGSAPLDEAAVLRSTLAMAEEMATLIRMRLNAR